MRRRPFRASTDGEYFRYEEELEAKPVWRLEDLGETGDILLEIQARWETLRAEAELLVSSHHWSGEAALWTRGEKELEDSGRWQQLWRCSCLSRSASTYAPSEPDWTDPDWISTSVGNFPDFSSLRTELNGFEVGIVEHDDNVVSRVLTKQQQQ